MPDASPNIVDSYALDAESGVGVFSLSDPIDPESYEEATTGVEVFDGEDWLPSDLVSYDPETPTELYCVVSALPDLRNVPWRIVSPVSAWTAGGRLLTPLSGTFGEPPDSLRAAKIADILLLTGNAKSRS